MSDILYHKNSVVLGTTMTYLIGFPKKKTVNGVKNATKKKKALFYKCGCHLIPTPIILEMWLMQSPKSCKVNLELDW